MAEAIIDLLRSMTYTMTWSGPLNPLITSLDHMSGCLTASLESRQLEKGTSNTNLRPEPLARRANIRSSARNPSHNLYAARRFIYSP